ncbi:MAG: recombination protein RmuC [Bacteroidota bacterium]|jgi:DNA recombination protein RmuC
MMFVFLAAGLVAGALIGWLFAKNSGHGAVAEVRKQLEVAEQERALLQGKIQVIQQQADQSIADIQKERQMVNQLTSTLTKAEAESTFLREKLDVQKQEVQNLQQHFTKEFENLANRILDEKSKKFVEQNRTNMDGVLTPLREKIRDFEQKVEAAYKQESAERNSLKGEIKNLMELNHRINVEAGNLTRALKGDNKAQGNWGEFILEKILESSGLEKGREYDTQVPLTDEEGRRFQPDVVVRLPDNKHIIVDSKVSLVAYEAMLSATEDADREQFKRDHLTSIRSHIKGLSEKSYQQLPGVSTPDFVLLFIPIESSFGLAVQEDKDLFTFAWDRRVVLVSPSTLFATLRTIASVWKQDRQTKNALEIAKIGGSLYDKFRGMMEDLKEVGVKMDAAKARHDEAIRKLGEGPGNVIRRVEELRKLGAKTNKELPASLLEQASEEQES